MSGQKASAKDLLPTASSKRTRRAAWSLLRPRWPLVALTLVVFIGAAAAGLVPPLALGAIVDGITSGDATALSSTDVITKAVIVIAVAAVLQSLLTTAGGLLVARVGEPALATLRENVVDRAVHLPAGQVEAGGTGDLLARVSGDVAVVAAAVRSAIPAVGGSALTIGMTIVGLAAVDWRFMLAGLAAVPIQLHTLRWYLRSSGPVYAAERLAEGRRSQTLFDAIGGARTVRAFGLQDRQLTLVTDSSLAAMGFTMRAVRLITRFFGRLNLAEFVGLSLILLTGFFLVNADVVGIGSATAAALLFSRLFDPINTVLGMFDELQSAAAGLARLVGVADLPQSRSTDRQTVVSTDPRSVTISGLGYSYRPGNTVLHGIDLHIEPGARIAVVGATGAGKTTLAKIVAGVLVPTEGSVRVGGVQLPPTGQIPDTVALVTQEVHVFAGTIADDLRLARPDASAQDLRAALELTGAADWVDRLPDGLACVVGDGGHRLTGLQSQQLALSRLALLDRPVVVLDEHTAEGGSAGSRPLDQAAERVLAGRTSLIVAHRLSQAALADRVVVMAGGRIVQHGTHQELIAQDGPYAELWSAWSRSRDGHRT